jgi:CRP-like cAMP-binding protein
MWLLQQLLQKNHEHRATLRNLAPGEAVFRMGDAGDYLAVLITGGVEIRKGKKRSLLLSLDPCSARWD